MSTRSLNKVMLIGNLTRDPELRYTPAGTAVCSFGLATNRSWTTEGGEKREEAEFHRIVSWNKLAELCSQLLTKGRKVYVEGRLQTRTWQGQDGTQRTTTEIVIDDMIILDSRLGTTGNVASPSVAPVADEASSTTVSNQTASSQPTADDTARPVSDSKKKKLTKTEEKTEETPVAASEPSEVAGNKEEINPDDIPF